MHVLLTVDENYGIAYNYRRQSRDRKVAERIASIVGKKTLWCTETTAKILGEIPGLKLSQTPLLTAGRGEYVFAERQQIDEVEEKIESIYLFHWNKVYPSDVRLHFDFSGWTKVSEEEFEGNSHPHITLERYVR